METHGKVRIGVMGGTFDPIHHGHLVAASEVGHIFSLHEVVFMPAGQPWQKEGRQVSAPEDRYLMTVIATASNPSFSVSRLDIDRPGPTYTIDTLRDLRAERGPDAELFFITGADAFRDIRTWMGFPTILDRCHFVAVSRPGQPAEGLKVLLPELAGRMVAPESSLPDQPAIVLVDAPTAPVSSTGCRQRVAEGQPIWYLVPDGIVQYIAKRELYKAPGE